MESIPPTLPFHLAKAYGVSPSQGQAQGPSQGQARGPVGGVQATVQSSGVQGGVSQTTASGLTVTPVGPGTYSGITRTQRGADSADLESVAKAASIRDRLVAATVPGGVSFGDQGPVPSAPVDRTPRAAEASLPFYRHPADKNAAAVAINLGSRLDTRG